MRAGSGAGVDSPRSAPQHALAQVCRERTRARRVQKRRPKAPRFEAPRPTGINVLEDDLGLRRENHGVRIQPGRPASWWTLDGACRAIGLPGNPVSALVTSHLFVRCWIEASLGLDPDARWLTVELENPVRRNPRRPMARPAHLQRDSTRFLANVPHWQGSGDLAHLAETDGMVLIEDGDASAAVGSVVPFLPW